MFGVRNTTEAITERFSIGKAALPSFPLFSVYLDEVTTGVAADFFLLFTSFVLF
jgi:Na+/H+-translocating membrane pyrophosphatase